MEINLGAPTVLDIYLRRARARCFALEAMRRLVLELGDWDVTVGEIGSVPDADDGVGQGRFSGLIQSLLQVHSSHCYALPISRMRDEI